MLRSVRMGPPHITRRRFAALLASSALTVRAQTNGPSLAHADVAKLDGPRILAEADGTLKRFQLPSTLAGRQPMQQSCHQVANLTAAWLVAHHDRYIEAATQLLARLLAADPPLLSATPVIADPTPSAPPATLGTLTIADLAPLAQVARAFSFLGDSEYLAPKVTQAVTAWLASFLDWLTTAHHPLLARDTKDHNASAWLLLVSAISRALRNDKVLEDCRQRFRKPTLRNQINLEGAFPHEVATETPFRNTLLNFDLLAGCAQLLSTPFADLWPYELVDGTSLRSVVAFLYPSLQERHNWPYIADPKFFRDLPGRRPGLLFAGRAFNRPEYVATWQATPAPDFAALPEAVAASFPIREPLLFTARAAHGL